MSIKIGRASKQIPIMSNKKRKEKQEMKLSAPQQATWWVALIIGVVGIIAALVPIPVLSGFALWLVVIAFVILVLATFLKGL